MLGKLMGKCKPCIFKGVGNNIGWESLNSDSLSSMDFAAFFHGKLMGKAKHFPCDEVYYRMGIWLEKYTHTMEKV